MAEPTDASNEADFTAIRRAFDDLFSADAITLPSVLDESGSFVSGDWSIEYRVNEVDGEPCLDVLAQTGGEMQLWRFLHDGEVEPGPSYTSMVIFDPDVDRSEADARRRYEQHNAHVTDVLRERGLQ
jgi:hypothetical protein